MICDDDSDDGEIDPFAELGVSSSGGGSFGAASVASDDPLAAFLDDAGEDDADEDDEDEDDDE